MFDSFVNTSLLGSVLRDISLVRTQNISYLLIRACMQALTAQKTKFPIKDFFSKCDQIRSFTADLVSFTEEILNVQLHFLCSD